MIKTVKRNFRISDELDQKLQEISKALDKNLTETFVHLLEAYLGRDSNQYQFLDKACPALIHGDEGFFCAFKLPRARPFKILSGSPDDARKACASCETMKPYQEAVQQLDKLKQSGYTVDIPYCARGGIVNENLKTIRCPKNGFETQVTGCAKNCDFYRVIHADARLAASRNENKK